MPRKARLFSSSSGSVVRAFLKFRANIPPRWIRNARASRKRVEPEIIRVLGKLKRLRRSRPGARVAIMFLMVADLERFEFRCFYGLRL